MSNLTGMWKLSAKVGHNRGTATFEFVENESGQLTGTYTGLVGSATVEGAVSGNNVQFSFDSQAGGRVTYKGTRDGEKLGGTCTYEAAGEGTFEGSRELRP